MFLFIKTDNSNENIDGEGTGSMILMISVDGRLYWHVYDEEMIPKEFEYYGTIQNNVTIPEELWGSDLQAIGLGEDTKIWTSPYKKEIVYAAKADHDRYLVFIENGFYQNKLVNVGGQIYIETNALIECLQNEDVYGDVPWVTNITDVEGVTTEYDKELENYTSLGELDCGDEYGFPTRDMTHPKQCDLSGKEVFRHIEEGYLVVGRIQHENQVYGTKFILNEP